MLGRKNTTFLLAGAILVCANTLATAAPAQRITLSDVHGKSRKVLSAIDGRPTAVLFLGHDCPISNKYSPEINRIIAQYGKRVSFFIVYADPDVAKAEALKHSQDFSYRCPALLDSKHKMVKRAGATVTPEAAVFDSRGRLAYRGRIDDTYIDYGKRRDAPTRKDLRLALDSVLKGKRVTPATTKAVGCFIPGKA